MFTTTPFSVWELKDELKVGLADNGWEFATQVQKDTIPLALQGKDVSDKPEQVLEKLQHLAYLQ